MLLPADRALETEKKVRWSAWLMTPIRHSRMPKGERLDLDFSSAFYFLLFVKDKQ